MTGTGPSGTDPVVTGRGPNGANPVATRRGPSGAMSAVDEAVAAAAAALAGRWPGLRLSDPEILDGSDRTVVLRAAVTGAPVPSVIVKVHLLDEPREAVVREPAGLSLLPHGRPEVLALLDKPPGIVLEDLGPGRDLADLLLGDDPAAATAGLHGWATALARLQRSTLGAGPAFAAELAGHAARLGLPVPPVDPMSAVLDDAARLLVEQLPRLGIDPPAAALEELRSLDGRLGTSFHALTPADACPDNNRETEAGWVLLDFEGAQVRHVAWDAAYLLVPWPSCWCCWRLPTGVGEQALQTWRTELGPPEVTSAAFDQDLGIAALGWTLVSTAWFLPRAVDGDEHTHEEAAVMPTRRTMVQHRLREAAAAPRAGLPALATLTQQLSDATELAWGRLSLDLAPAYRGVA